MSVEVQFTGGKPNQESFFYSVISHGEEIARLRVAFLARAFPNTISYERAEPNVLEGLLSVYESIADEPDSYQRSYKANAELGIWGSQGIYEDRQIARVLTSVEAHEIRL